MLIKKKLFKKIIRIANFAPVTWDDYKLEHSVPFFDRSGVFCRDMVYMTVSEKEFYNFDAEGVWHEAGLDTQALSLDENYDEKKFFDCLRPYHP